MIFAQIIKKGWRPFMNTILANFFNDFKERFESFFDSLEMPDPENHDASIRMITTTHLPASTGEPFDITRGGFMRK